MYMRRASSLRLFILLSFAAASFVFARTLPASAQVNFLFDKGQYIMNHPGQNIQTFEAGKAPVGFYETCVAPVNQFSDDNCFSPGDILPGLEFASTPFDTSSIYLAGINFFGAPNAREALALAGGAGTFDVFFEGGVNSAGLTVGCFVEGPGCNFTLTLMLYSTGDVLLGSVQVEATDAFNTFLGFDSAVPVARVAISGELENASQAVDEVRFGSLSRPIPTMSEWGMIAAATGLGFVGVFFAVRRRRAAV